MAGNPWTGHLPEKEVHKPRFMTIGTVFECVNRQEWTHW